MKRILILLLAMLLVLTACKSEEEPDPVVETPEVEVDEEQLMSKAIDFFDLYITSDFEGAYEVGFDATMKSAFKAEMMKSVHDQIGVAYGPYKERVGEIISESQGFMIVSIGTHHEHRDLIYNVVFNDQGEIAGFHYNEAKDLADFTGEKPTEAPNGIHGLAVMFGEEDFKLEGTLLIPEGDGPFPAVVLVHGSGSTDRDESIIGNKPFKDLAEGLLEKGIAVLRYDKRTYTHSHKYADPDLAEKFTIYDETINDARYAVDYLEEVEGIDPDKIYVLGHSLGGNQAPRIAEGRSDIAGIVVMGGNVTPLQDLMLYQYHYIYDLQGEMDAETKKIIDVQIAQAEAAVANINSLSETQTFKAEELFGVPATYWMDLKDYDPTEIAKELDIPILILQGGRDYQVPPEELDKWKAALGDQAEYRIYEKLNHLFMPGEGTPSPDDYQIPGHVSDEVIEDIAQWIQENN